MEKVAQQELPNAQNVLDYMYELSLGIEQDYEKAAALFLQAAEQGYAVLQYNLGQDV